MVFENVRLLPCLLSFFFVFSILFPFLVVLLLHMPIFHLHFTSSFGSSCIMTKRDSVLAGFTSPSSSMNMPRRQFRPHGVPSSAAPSVASSHHPPSGTGLAESTTWPSSSDTLHHEQPSLYGYSTEPPPVPLPSSADNQHPFTPVPTENYPLQREMEQRRRQLHAHFFIEVIDPSHPETRRLMVTEVDRHGVHRNRQPEFFFNGIIGHIRADRNGWIDSWDPTCQLLASPFQYPRRDS